MSIGDLLIDTNAIEKKVLILDPLGVGLNYNTLSRGYPYSQVTALLNELSTLSLKIMSSHINITYFDFITGKAL